MSAGRVLLIVFGSIISLIGLALLVGGGGLLWANQSLKDDDGYFTSRTERFVTGRSAIVSENLDVADVPGGSDRWADLRIRATPRGGKLLFLGIGPRDEVNQYLSGVSVAELTDVDFDPFRATYRLTGGNQRPAPPGDQDFWAVKVEGSGTQTLTWDVDEGNWQVVAMNADGSPGVNADASLGVKISYVLGVAIGLLVVGVVFLGGGITMIIFGARSRRPPPPAAPAVPVAPDGPGEVPPT